MDTILYQQIEQLISPVIAILVFTLIGVYAVLLFFVFKFYFNKDDNKDADKECSDKKCSLNDSFDLARRLDKKLDIIDYEHTNIRNYYKFDKIDKKLISLEEKSENIDVIEGAILELNERLNNIEIYINKNNKKVGKKNGSKM